MKAQLKNQPEIARGPRTVTLNGVRLTEKPGAVTIERDGWRKHIMRAHLQLPTPGSPNARIIVSGQTGYFFDVVYEVNPQGEFSVAVANRGTIEQRVAGEHGTQINRDGTIFFTCDYQKKWVALRPPVMPGFPKGKANPARLEFQQGGLTYNYPVAPSLPDESTLNPIHLGSPLSARCGQTMLENCEDGLCIDGRFIKGGRLAENGVLTLGSTEQHLDGRGGFALTVQTEQGCILVNHTRHGLSARLNGQPWAVEALSDGSYWVADQRVVPLVNY